MKHTFVIFRLHIVMQHIHIVMVAAVLNARNQFNHSPSKMWVENESQVQAMDMNYVFGSACDMNIIFVESSEIVYRKFDMSINSKRMNP